MNAATSERLDEARHWSALMAKAQAGDGPAFVHLLSDIVPVIRRMVAKRRPGLGDNEDVVQEVLLTLHSIRHTYDPARPFLPWLAAIVAHRCADATRSQTRHLRRTTNIDEMPETIGAVETNTYEMDKQALHKAMANLPQGQRTALELVKMKEMSLSEAAHASGMSEGALKVAVHRAIKALKGMLGP